jgi:hypothetical protein
MALHCARVVLAALLVPLAGCFFAISTSPTGFNQGNIIVIVRTEDSGVAVSGAKVTIRGQSATVIIGGTTDGEGRFAVALPRTDQELRAVVEIPAGFSAPAAVAGVLDVLIPPGSDEVTVWLRRDR